jgi:hypothetical protein
MSQYFRLPSSLSETTLRMESGDCATVKRLKQQAMNETATPMNGNAYMLVGGPKNVPLMLEQSGLRYATLFSSEEAVARFQQACCSLESYESHHLTSRAQIAAELERTRKFGCSLLLIDPPGPEVNQKQSQVLAAFLRNNSDDSEK